MSYVLPDVSTDCMVFLETQKYPYNDFLSTALRIG